jgi:hypothetical protein
VKGKEEEQKRRMRKLITRLLNVSLVQRLEGVVNFKSRTDSVRGLLPPHLLTSLDIRILFPQSGLKAQLKVPH